MSEPSELEDLIGSLLTTEDGQSLTEVVFDLKTDLVHQLTVQNKILLKLLTAVSPAPALPKEAPSQ